MDIEIAKRDLVMTIVIYLDNLCTEHRYYDKSDASGRVRFSSIVHGEFDVLTYDKLVCRESYLHYFLSYLVDLHAWQMTHEVELDLNVHGVWLSADAVRDDGAIKYHAVVSKFILSHSAKEFREIYRVTEKITKVLNTYIKYVVDKDEWFGYDAELGEICPALDSNCAVTRRVRLVDKNGDVIKKLRFTADKFNQPSYVEL